MRFIQVEYADICRMRPKTKLEAELSEFIRMNVKSVEVSTDGHYKSSKVAYNVLWVAIKRHGFPIKVITRKGKVYLIRTDM